LLHHHHLLLEHQRRLLIWALQHSPSTSASNRNFNHILLTLAFSYDAAEDNEITFREGDVITEIEPASEDWWQGKNPHGDVGLFPGVFLLIVVFSDI